MTEVVTCEFSITKNWELDACNKPATCIVRDEFEGETFLAPACTYHAHRNGSAVALTPGVAQAIRVSAGDLR